MDELHTPPKPLNVMKRIFPFSRSAGQVQGKFKALKSKWHAQKDKLGRSGEGESSFLQSPFWRYLLSSSCLALRSAYSEWTGMGLIRICLSRTPIYLTFSHVPKLYKLKLTAAGNGKCLGQDALTCPETRLDHHGLLHNDTAGKLAESRLYLPFLLTAVILKGLSR